MIKLYMYAPAFGLRNPSPFCLKVEMALTLLRLDFKVELLGDPRKAPKGKLPFIEMEGERIADSELILERLDRLTGGQLFGDLTPVERSQGTAFTRLAEDHVYWLLVTSRWFDDDWWPNTRDAFFAALPRVPRALIARLARTGVRKAVRCQGLGRHSLAEQKRFLARDLEAISNAVEHAGLIAGPRITVFDLAVAAQISSMLDNVPATWATHVASEFPALQDYAERVQQATGTYGREPANYGSTIKHERPALSALVAPSDV
jgi:glutathione S-transferase